jgi:excisionase family DNA binding protein
MKANITPITNMRNFVTHIEAAAILCISPKTLYKWCCERRIKHYKCGKLNLYKLSQLEDFLESGVVEDLEGIKENARTHMLNLQNKAA